MENILLRHTEIKNKKYRKTYKSFCTNNIGMSPMSLARGDYGVNRPSPMGATLPQAGGPGIRSAVNPAVDINNYEPQKRPPPGER